MRLQDMMNFTIQSVKGTTVLLQVQRHCPSTRELILELAGCSDDNVSLSDPESDTDAGESGSEEVSQKTVEPSALVLVDALHAVTCRTS